MIMKMHFPPEFDLDLFWHFEGVKSGGKQPSRASQRIAVQLLPEALALADPAAYFQSFGVRRIQKKWLELENSACFTGGLVGRLLGGSREEEVVMKDV